MVTHFISCRAPLFTIFESPLPFCAQRENLHLVTLGTRGSPYTARSAARGEPDKVYAISDDDGDASRAFRYGAEGLTMSAMEQQLELAEREVSEA